MWKKGELVWVRLNPSDSSWIPGRIIDPSEPFGILVSFFDLMEPSYVPKLCLRSFERDFETLIADSWRYRHFVNRALQTHFSNISFGLWCSCQRPWIDSPYLDREISLPGSRLSSDSALGFVREMAVSRRVSLRRLVETNSSTAQILSFRRYTVDFNLSESVYEQVRESAKLMDRVEEPNWCLDPSNKMDCTGDIVPPMFPGTEHDSNDLSLKDPLPKDIPCCSVEQPVDKLVQSCTWNTRRPLVNSDSSVMKACAAMARTSNHEDAAHLLKSREYCEVEQSICLQDSESPIEDTIEEDTTPVTAPIEIPPDVMIETHDVIMRSHDRTVTSAAKQLSPLLDASNDKAFLAKPVSFVVLEASKNLACSVEDTAVNPRSKLDSSFISANTLDVDLSDRNNCNGTRENFPDDASESHFVDVGQVSIHTTGSSNKEFGSDDVGIAPAEQLLDLEVATTLKDKISAVEPIGVKRKKSRDKAAAKRRKKANQQSISVDKPQNLQVLKAKLLADPKCLRMKFLSSSHVNLPSKSELLKRFSVFGKIDASRTDVNPGQSSAKVVFLRSIDAVTAYQFARSKKFKLGRSKVVYRLHAFEEDIEVNKAPLSQKPIQSVPSPRSCLKIHGSVDKEEGRSHLKVKFQMATNS
ncbi:unnamed protein product [Eruca vesicaria subsp. sativa]|uniref:RRM domain-containing protein n=1 Tax=Eruca vesicaria subsp. sativa TaxID=29727 RepID=A0ABC8KBV5_ERUVS|nr:unnamed protein product [Eruca vesicaria subsp. sativa]